MGPVVLLGESDIRPGFPSLGDSPKQGGEVRREMELGYMYFLGISLCTVVFRLRAAFVSGEAAAFVLPRHIAAAGTIHARQNALRLRRHASFN